MKKIVKSFRKRTFTLIELLIFFSILALVAAVVTVRTMALVSYHRFSSSATLLYDSLRHMQMLAVVHKMDCRVIVTCEDKKYYFQCENDADLVRADFFGKRVFMPSVDEIKIGKDVLKEKTFMVYSSGIIEPQEMVELSHQLRGSARSLYIDLTMPLALKLKIDKSHGRASQFIDVPALPH